MALGQHNLPSAQACKHGEAEAAVSSPPLRRQAGGSVRGSSGGCGGGMRGCVGGGRGGGGMGWDVREGG